MEWQNPKLAKEFSINMSRWWVMLQCVNLWYYSFSALYLAYILLMATIAVCCTTLVINLHMRTDDESMPDWLKNFTFNYLVKIACWKNSCFCKRNKVENRRSTTPTHSPNDIFVTAKSRQDDQTESVSSDESRDLTWKELSEIMDQLFYYIYMFLIILSTFILFMIIIGGYYTSSWTYMSLTIEVKDQYGTLWQCHS